MAAPLSPLQAGARDLRQPSGIAYASGAISTTASSRLPIVDDQLRARLQELTQADAEFWTFAKGAHGADAQRYIQYPAMMVPLMQRALLATILEVQPAVQGLLDGFAGSGTVLSEAMLAGISGYGQDINPLAVLVCRAKAGPFAPEELQAAAADVLSRARVDTSFELTAEFPNRDKWFRQRAAEELSRLRRAIRAESALWVRRFLWVTLAETIRLTSNSRTSTYKLHVRPLEEIASLSWPLETFERVLEENLHRHARFSQELRSANRLIDGALSTASECALADTRKPISGKYDLLVTSPPYGDNTSTVPYGQSSYLPLQWIDLEDIDRSAAIDCRRSTYEIDGRSLGGVHPRGNLAKLSADLQERSPSFRSTMSALSEHPRDRQSRVYSFVRDLDACLDPLVNALRLNSYLVWTVGNRRVGGHQIPLDQILIELLSLRKVVHVTTVYRRIPNKRMATRNTTASTMRAEATVILRRHGARWTAPS